MLSWGFSKFVFGHRLLYHSFFIPGIWPFSEECVCLCRHLTLTYESFRHLKKAHVVIVKVLLWEHFVYLSMVCSVFLKKMRELDKWCSKWQFLKVMSLRTVQKEIKQRCETAPVRYSITLQCTVFWTLIKHGLSGCQEAILKEAKPGEKA